jgi:hypothetical protein
MVSPIKGASLFGMVIYTILEPVQLETTKPVIVVVKHSSQLVNPLEVMF